MAPVMLDLSLFRLEANPGDTIVIRLAEAMTPPEYLPLRDAMQELASSGYHCIVLCSHEAIEVWSDEKLAGVGLQRVSA